jgi:purine-binding chemotaxis protein CheW
MSRQIQDILVLEVAGQLLALACEKVRELTRAVYITPVPGRRKCVEGVFNLRGEIIPVLDIRQWLGLPARTVDPSDHFVVTWVNKHVIALRVDRAREFAQLETDEVNDAHRRQDGDTGTDLVNLPGGIAIIPDLAQLLSQCQPIPFNGIKPELAAQGERQL